MNLDPRFRRMRENFPQARDMIEAQWLLTALNQEYPWRLPANEIALALWRVDPLALQAVIDQTSGNPSGSLLLTPAAKRAEQQQAGQ
jgi:hypothetical protein